jgi:hypothetical protein
MPFLVVDNKSDGSTTIKQQSPSASRWLSVVPPMLLPAENNEKKVTAKAGFLFVLLL